MLKRLRKQVFTGIFFKFPGDVYLVRVSRARKGAGGAKMQKSGYIILSLCVFAPLFLSRKKYFYLPVFN